MPVLNSWLSTWIGLVLLIVILEMMAPVDAARGKGMGRRRGSRKGGNRFELPGQSSGGYLNQESIKYYGNTDGARITKWSHFDAEYTLGRKIIFICVARGNPLPTITWFHNGIELYAHPFYQVHQWKLEGNKVKSKMEIDPATQKDAGIYECEANNRFSVDRRAFRTDYSITYE